MKTNQDLVILKSVIQPNLLADLFDEYDRELEAVKRLASFGETHKEVMHYFTSAHSSVIKCMVDDIFDLKLAKAELDASYWFKVIRLTDVLQVMPAKAREALNEQIRKKEIAFSRETVIQTIHSLLLQRGSFLADKVDGIHTSLSGKHVTNSPMAFRTRMIVGWVTTMYGDKRNPSYMTGRNCEVINDLRQVITQLQGRDIKVYPNTSADVRFIIDQKAFGEWFHFDGGAFSMKIFKAGTAHLDVHPEIALKLNEILAEKYPMVIGDVKGNSKTRKEPAHTELRRDVLSYEVIQVLAQAAEQLSKSQEIYTYNMKDSQAFDEAVKVFEFLGGKESRVGYFFESDVYDVLKKIMIQGYLPEKVSHQFYPTKPELAKRLVEMAEIKKSHQVLEPSAGQGGIADFFPNKNNSHCIEVNAVNCEILKKKNFVVTNDDFLSYDEGTLQYDRIVMNPPFHNRQAFEHVHHAATMLKKGGVLVAVMPASYKDNNRVFHGSGVEVTWSEVLENQFDDTSVSVVIAKAVRVR